MNDGSKARNYRKRKRARQEQETRLRITEVLVEMHRTVGPANTKVTEVAERAGVSRMTVYNHFPTDAALMDACSAHWSEQNPFPDPAEWAAVSDRGQRLRSGLAELYQWYRGTQDMMENILRDAPIVPALGKLMDARWWTYIDRVVDVLDGGRRGAGEVAERRAVLRLAVDFRTWQILAGSGLDDARAASLSARMVECGPR